MAEGVGGLGLYGRLVGQSVRAQLQYRWSFLLMAFGNMVTSGVEVIGIWALFDRFGSLGAWRLAEVAFLYGLVNAAFAVAESAMACWSARRTHTLTLLSTKPPVSSSISSPPVSDELPHLGARRSP